MTKTLLPELHDKEARQAIAESVLSLLQRWNLHEINQSELLGLPSIVEVYQRKLQTANAETMTRIGHILAIDRALQKRFPHEPARRDQWIFSPNMSLNDETPLSTMLKSGLPGILLVRNLIESQQQT